MLKCFYRRTRVLIHMHTRNTLTSAVFSCFWGNMRQKKSKKYPHRLTRIRTRTSTGLYGKKGKKFNVYVELCVSVGNTSTKSELGWPNVNSSLNTSDQTIYSNSVWIDSRARQMFQLNCFVFSCFIWFKFNCISFSEVYVWEQKLSAKSSNWKIK